MFALLAIGGAAGARKRRAGGGLGEDLGIAQGLGMKEIPL